MIAEVNVALSAVLIQSLPPDARVDFGHPGAEPREGCGVNLFLYGVCEDPKGRGTAWSDLRDDSGTLLGRTPPRRRFRLSYVATAWGTDPDEEVRLLDAALSAFTRWEDAGLADGSGSPPGADVLLAMEIARADGAGRPWEVLTSAQAPVSAAFDLAVTTFLVHETLTELAPRAKQVALGVEKGAAPHGGPRREPQTPEPVADPPRGRPAADHRPAAAPEDKKWQQVRIREHTNRA